MKVDTKPRVISKTTNILVIGGGHAGLCAAISARELGASVTLIEAGDRAMRGGNSRHTRNLRVMHNTPTACLVDAYTENEYWQDLLRVTGGQTNEMLARLTIQGSEPLLDWLMSHGVHFQPSLKGTLNLERTNAFFLGGGCALINALYIYAEKIGVCIHYGEEVVDVYTTNARFERCRTATGRCFSADALIVACGGFQANETWMAENWGPAAKNFLIRGTPYNRGIVLKALLDQGFARVGDPTQCHAVAIDARAPKYDGGIVSRLDSIPFGIVVNREAERFYDEGDDFWPKRYAIWGRLIAQQPDQIAYSIVDAKVIDKFMPSVFPAIQAETLTRLAGLLDLDAKQLQTTVSVYNQSIQPGRYDSAILDDARTEGIIPGKSHWALPIDTPPFYAYPVRPGITFTYLGLEVDKQARVMMEDGNASLNVFAAGEIMAGNVLGQGYCAGTGMTIGGVFGRMAGTHAANQASP